MYGKRIIAAGLLLLAVGCTKAARSDQEVNARPGQVVVEEIKKPKGFSLRARVGGEVVKRKLWRIMMRGPAEEDKDKLLVKICQNAGGCVEKDYR